MSDENHVLTQDEADELLAKFDRESNVRQFSGLRNYFINGLLLLFAAYVFGLPFLPIFPNR